MADIDIFPKEPLSGDMQVRYVALEDANANYSGMASAYRSYLLKQNKIKQAEFGPELPFHLRVIGAVTDKQPFWAYRWIAESADNLPGNRLYFIGTEAGGGRLPHSGTQRLGQRRAGERVL